MTAYAAAIAPALQPREVEAPSYDVLDVTKSAAINSMRQHRVREPSMKAKEAEEASTLFAARVQALNSTGAHMDKQFSAFHRITPACGVRC